MFDEDEMFEEDDEDVEDDEYFSDEDEEDNEMEERSYAAPNETLSSFINDPWPKTVFILLLIGLAFVLFTPNSIWSLWHYYLVTTYGLIVLVGVSCIISLGVWKKAGESRLRWGGVTTLIVDVISGVVGVLDSISVVTTGSSIIPGANTPILALATLIVVFSLYTLWLIQRTFNVEGAN